MIEITITEEQRSRAEELYDFGALNNSITKGRSNKFGAIGEIITADYFKEKGRSVDTASTYDYDLIVDGYTIDVKSKKTNVKPQPHYLATVANYNTTQQCDFYLFIRVLKDLSKAWILGYIKPVKFYELSNFVKKGDLDVNGWEFKDDCYNLQIRELNPLRS
jgi:penicillin-binding protein-related factor A (putative recombinase)